MLNHEAYIIFISFWILILLAQDQPGLHVDQGQTVLFGQDTSSSCIKILWYPSKAAFRVGNSSTTEWINQNVGPL